MISSQPRAIAPDASEIRVYAITGDILGPIHGRNGQLLTLCGEHTSKTLTIRDDSPGYPCVRSRGMPFVDAIDVVERWASAGLLVRLG